MSSFNEMTDPRRTNKGNHHYSLDEILFLVISAVISGMDGWTSIELFGKTKLDWLRNFFPFKKGIPSHDVLGKLFARLDAKQFSICFTEWVNSIAKITEGEVVAIDGKTIRKSNDDTSSKSALHLVSAYACDNGICLAQEAVREKSNEITAIPKLLDIIAIKGCVVTIDAMGCQRKIAEKIIQKNADYLLMVKDNQKSLKSQIEKIFDEKHKPKRDETLDSGHGRVETRICEVIDNLDSLEVKEKWKGIKSIVRITSERYVKKTGKTSNEIRYYITSLDANAMKINKAVRSHWSIENNLHWVLDVIFNEDTSLKKKGNSPMNFNVITKIALALIDREKSTKMSKNSKRNKAALDDKYRAKVLQV
ncbi:MAG: ISAs1 family transposase [Bacteroidota bacterium]|nr:ISAs1 family transposase [Bacteroidota bacterium]